MPGRQPPTLPLRRSHALLWPPHQVDLKFTSRPLFPLPENAPTSTTPTTSSIQTVQKALSSRPFLPQPLASQAHPSPQRDPWVFFLLSQSELRTENFGTCHFAVSGT